jgi:hypothetical protein
MAECFCGCGREFKRRQFLMRRASQRGEEITRILKPLIANDDGGSALMWHLIEMGNAYFTGFQILAHGGRLNREAQEFLREYQRWMPRAEQATADPVTRQ